MPRTRLIMSCMSAPFGVEARCERASIATGETTLWATIRIDPRGKALEAERAPLAIALVIDVSGSMQGDPIEHVRRSCEIVCELLGPSDLLAIVTFGDHAGIRLGLTSCDGDGRKLVGAAVHGVVAGGSTNMHAGIAAAAGLLATAPPGLRRAMVVLSDGQPNVGMSSPDQLAQYVGSLRPLGVSALGFGIHHDENVLAALANAGSGRYAYVSDPIGARVDLARAALAHGGIVAEAMQLELRPAPGVELLRVLPATQLRHGGQGVRASIGDVFIDEFRLIAVELGISSSGFAPSARGQLAELTVEGRAPDGTTYKVHGKLVVDVHGGPHAIVRDAQRDILLLRADAARMEARAHADRGANPAAVSLLRTMIAAIEASEGFVRDDGSPLAEMREQLEDEAANYDRKASKAEVMHMRKGTYAFTPTLMPARTQSRPPALAALVGLSHAAQNQRFELHVDTYLGRSQSNEVPLPHESLSRRHARILFVDGAFRLFDLGSTNGCEVNGRRLGHDSVELRHGDIVKLGYVEFRFEAKTP
jgi:Ca-activated chloride channel homolog